MGLRGCKKGWEMSAIDGQACGDVLAVSSASREALGLDADAELRVVARAGRMTLLENGDVRGAILPTDRDSFSVATFDHLLSRIS